MNLRLPLLVIAVATFHFGLASTGFAAAGIFSDFVIINNGTSTTYYDLQSTSSNPDFEPANLGSFDSTSGTLTLQGFQVNTFEDNGDVVNSATGYYRVYLQGSTAPAFSSLNLPQSGDKVGNNRRWEVTNANINLLSGLANGTYVIDVYDTASGSWSGGSYTLSSGSPSNPYTATFTVVPEPSTWAAGFVAVAAVSFLQRRRVAALVSAYRR